MSDIRLVTITTDASSNRNPIAVVGGVHFGGKTNLDAARKAIHWIIEELECLRVIHPEWFREGEPHA